MFTKVFKQNGCYLKLLRFSTEASKPPTSSPATTSTPPVFKSDSHSTVLAYPPKNYEKYFLVWSGHYKSVAQVPPYVSAPVIEKARAKARIRISNISMLLTLVACCVMVWSGKNAAAKGETVWKMNRDWHLKYNEDYAKKEAAEALKKEAEAAKNLK